MIRQNETSNRLRSLLPSWAHLPLLALPVLLLLGPKTFAVEVGQVFDFEDGSVAGWAEGPSSPNPPLHVADGGNPGGFLQNESAGTGRAGSRWVMFNRGDFAGDLVSANVTGVQLDLKNFSRADEALPIRFAIEGTESTRFSSTEPFSLPKDDQWHTATFNFTTDELTQILGSADLQTVLSDVAAVRLLVAQDTPEWIGDVVAANVGVDNITILGNQIALPELQAGDADEDLDFDQFDLVKVQIASKYLSGQAATWGDGDWDGAPGGTAGSPPAGDGLFNQFDVIAAQIAGVYLTGPYAAISADGVAEDQQTSIIYDASSGEISVDPPAGTELTSINIDSSSGIFTGVPATNLGGSFDNDSDSNIFKATFGGSFGSLSLGNVAQSGLSQEFLMGDLTVVGSLAGGGDLGEVDLIYVPEPATCMLALLAVCVAGVRARCQGRVPSSMPAGSGSE